LRLSIYLSIAFVLILASPNDLRSAVTTEDATTQAVVNKFLDATRTQQEALRGMQMEVKIAASLPRLAKAGELQALRSISKLGKITYRALGFSGDNTVKNEVISRYVKVDTEPHEVAITPANYKFKYKGATYHEGKLVEIVQVMPKRKAVGLFHGELWLDSATGMPLRESGRFVKSPSVFLKKIEFVSSFEIRDGVAIPKHFESTVDTRLVGRAELKIDFSNFSRSESADDNSSVFPR
jgi:hypothetical protein